MMEKLYKTCCRLCLHDGSTQQLLDILSVKGLKENISNIFNIEVRARRFLEPQTIQWICNLQIDTRDCCTTNVCLNCFNETLSMEKEFQLYEEQKRIILANQLRLQENPSEATSELASSALASSVACIEGDAGGKKSVNAPERSRKAPKVAPYNLNSKKDQSMKTQRISIDPVNVNLEETKNQQNKSITKTIKDKTKKIKLVQNAPAKTKTSCKESVQEKNPSQNVVVVPVANLQHQLEQSQKEQTENANECTNATDSNELQRPKPGIVVTGILKRRIEKPQNLAPVQSKSSINNTTVHRSADVNKTQPNNAHNVVLSSSNIVHDAVESNSINAVNIQRQEAHASNNEPRSFVIQKVVTFQGSTQSKETTTIASAVSNTNGGMVWINSPVNQPVTVQSNYGNSEMQNKGQGPSPPLTVFNIPAIAVQQGATASVPLHNALTTVVSSVDSSATNSTLGSSTATQVARCSVTTILPQTVFQARCNTHSSMPALSIGANAYQGSPLPAMNNANDSANQSSLTTNNTNLVTDQQPSSSSNETTSETGNNVDISNTSPAALTKKRRHSTYIRVSSNLFDEPPERAQFAMLNNNLLLRNFETQMNAPTPSHIVRLPVLPPGRRVQAVPNPTMLPGNQQTPHPSLNNYQWQNNVNNVQRLRHIAPTSTSIAGTVGNSANSGIFSTTVNNSTIVQQQFSGSSLIHQGRVVSHNSNLNQLSVTNINHTAGIVDRTASVQTDLLTTNYEVNSRNATLAKDVGQQPSRPCFRCNICNTYYLIEHNLQSHLHRVHNVEKTEQTCSKVYDANILNKLLTRFRRKSIADPLTLSNNRTQLN